jgi:hypothetical protein
LTGSCMISMRLLHRSTAQISTKMVTYRSVCTNAAREEFSINIWFGDFLDCKCQGPYVVGLPST